MRVPAYLVVLLARLFALDSLRIAWIPLDTDAYTPVYPQVDARSSTCCVFGCD